MIEPIGQLKEVVSICYKYANLADILCHVTYWDRKEYFKSDLNDANIFVLMLPGNAWEYPIDALPVGCRKELNIAREANKRIYIAYKNKAGEYNIYFAQFWNSRSGGMIQGITGSSNKLYDCLKSLQSKNEKPM